MGGNGWKGGARGVKRAGELGVCPRGPTTSPEATSAWRSQQRGHRPRPAQPNGR